MARSSCHKFPPAAIPVDGLTHVNFAFAYIDPDTFKITTMDDATPADLFTQTADVRTLKLGNGDLEVFVSIGGWTFSDNNTATQPVFSNIASCMSTPYLSPSLNLLSGPTYISYLKRLTHPSCSGGKSPEVCEQSGRFYAALWLRWRRPRLGVPRGRRSWRQRRGYRKLCEAPSDSPDDL